MAHEFDLVSTGTRWHVVAENGWQYVTACGRLVPNTRHMESDEYPFTGRKICLHCKRKAFRTIHK